VTGSETSSKDLWLSEVKDHEINASLTDKLSHTALEPTVEASHGGHNSYGSYEEEAYRPLTAHANANVVPVR
jgi:hypothetical protein